MKICVCTRGNVLCLPHKQSLHRIPCFGEKNEANPLLESVSLSAGSGCELGCCLPSKRRGQRTLPQIWLLGKTQGIGKHRFHSSGQRANQELTRSEVSCEPGVEEAVRATRGTDLKG